MNGAQLVATGRRAFLDLESAKFTFASRTKLQCPLQQQTC